MPNPYNTIERYRPARPSSDGAGFRVLVPIQPGARPLLVSMSSRSSITRAKRKGEVLVGALAWREESTDVKAAAFLESTR